MKLLSVSAVDLPKVLPMREAVEAMKAAFASLSEGRVVAPSRGAVTIEEADGTTLLMGAYVPGEGLAAKTVSIFNRNPESGRPVVTGLLLVLDPGTGEPIGLLDGAAVTAWRTGAACGAATDMLARADARVGAVIGAGVQARTQLLAMDAVRDLEEIRVFGLDVQQLRRFVEAMRPEVAARVAAAGSADAAVEGADIVTTATNSPTPVFDGRRLGEGTHVNAIGTFTLDRRELDYVTVERSRVYVDLVEAALEEAGELVAAMRKGMTESRDWMEIGRVASGDDAGRTSEEEITLFKSVGHAVQDVVAASRAILRARELGMTRTVDL